MLGGARPLLTSDSPAGVRSRAARGRVDRGPLGRLTWRCCCAVWSGARHRREPKIGAAPQRCCYAAAAALEEGETAQQKRGEREERAAEGHPA
ncbi:hypothetical protein NDU88_001827 [Pleurodeles waltl]|uniref:Uncharacterized protein n=1 Tax=Pleurodeles waltl TaxID=8319 RepID=A0AAV7UTT3_PLEWA|nr:hypothetical protein NDU88_001827 [Pleurodeles waltl]